MPISFKTFVKISRLHLNKEVVRTSSSCFGFFHRCNLVFIVLTAVEFSSRRKSLFRRRFWGRCFWAASEPKLSENANHGDARFVRRREACKRHTPGRQDEDDSCR